MRKDTFGTNQIPNDYATADTAEHKLLKQGPQLLMPKMSLLVSISQKI